MLEKYYIIKIGLSTFLFPFLPDPYRVAGMIVTLLKSKIHRAAVTQCDLHYEGSITIDADLIAAAGLFVNEQVDVLNINTGQRFTTYVLEGEPGSGIIGINGAAARLAQKGDLVIICAYGRMDAAEAEEFQPSVVFVDAQNKIKTVADHSGHDGSTVIDMCGERA